MRGDAIGQAMRRLLYVLGTLTLIFIAVDAIGFGILAYQGRALDAESKVFVDTAVPAIASNWSGRALLDRATPEFRNGAHSAKFGWFFEKLAQLGQLVEYKGAIGGAKISFVLGSGHFVSASYVAEARFQHGDASFRIELLKREGHWMINTFYVDPALAGKSSRDA